MKHVSTILYLGFVLALGFSCYRLPIPGEFDRFLYEGVIRTDRHEDPQQVYDSIRRESPRMEESAHSGLFDSADHFVKLEPLYRVKPLYLLIVRTIARSGVSIQAAISLVSAASLCGLGIILLLWTRSPLLCALLLAAPVGTALGRSGTPDAVAAAFFLSALWAVKANRPYIGLVLLVAAVWVRTDSVLLLVSVCIWVVLTKRVSRKVALAFGLAGFVSVLLVNRLAGAYSWTALFRYSFIGGRPDGIGNVTITAREYINVFLSNVVHLAPQVALFMLVGVVAWRLSRTQRDLIAAVALAASMHYVLFPSPEQRYLLWASLAVGVALILSLKAETRPQMA